MVRKVKKKKSGKRNFAAFLLMVVMAAFGLQIQHDSRKPTYINTGSSINDRN